MLLCCEGVQLPTWVHTSSVKDHFDDTDCCADATGDDDYDIDGSDDVGAEDLRLTSQSLKERIG